MALTRIKRHMIADSAVMPNNIVSTATYTVGGVTSSGAITGTNITASGTVTAPTQVTTPKIAVSGSSGLKIDTLRVNTGSWITYYDPTSKEVTYGPITGTTGTLAVYDQSLNTTDAVKFAQVTATTSLSVGATSITNTGTLRISGVSKSLQSFALLYNPTNNAVSYWDVPNQTLATTSSVTFANLTVTNVLKAGGNVYPTTSGINGQVLKTNGSGTLSWTTVTNYDQSLNTTNAVQFDRLTLESSTPGTSGGSITFASYPGIGLGTITSTLNGIDGEMKMSGTKVELDGSKRVTLKSADAGGGAYLDVVYSTVRSQRRVDLTINRDGTYSTWSFTATNLTFPDGTTQSTAAGPAYNQSLNTTNNVTFNDVRANGTISTNNIDAIGPSDSITLNQNCFITSSGDVWPRGSVMPVGPRGSNGQTSQYLGSPTARWGSLYVSKIVTSNQTIYFEEYDEITSSTISTSTLSLTTGTISINGQTVLDQSVAIGASPTFTTATFATASTDHIETFTANVGQVNATTASISNANLNTLTVNELIYPNTDSTSGYALVTNGSGAIQFQPAVLTSNVSIDGGFANSVYTGFDYAIDGGGASA